MDASKNTIANREFWGERKLHMRALSPPWRSLTCQAPREGSGQGVPSSETLLQGRQSLAGYRSGSPAHHGPLGHFWGCAGKFFYHVSYQSSYLRVRKTRAAERSLPLPPKGLCESSSWIKRGKTKQLIRAKPRTATAPLPVQQIENWSPSVLHFSLKPLVQKLIYPKCRQ